MKNFKCELCHRPFKALRKRKFCSLKCRRSKRILMYVPENTKDFLLDINWLRAEIDGKIDLGPWQRPDGSFDQDPNAHFGWDVFLFDTNAGEIK